MLDIKRILENGERELTRVLSLRGCTIATRPFASENIKFTASYTREYGDEVAIGNIIEQLNRKIPDGFEVYIYGIFEDGNDSFYSLCAIEFKETVI